MILYHYLFTEREVDYERRDSTIIIGNTKENKER